MYKQVPVNAEASNSDVAKNSAASLRAIRSETLLSHIITLRCGEDTLWQQPVPVLAN
jgi:hypothetical protein